jgi:hypothetical protein
MRRMMTALACLALVAGSSRFRPPMPPDSK